MRASATDAPVRLIAATQAPSFIQFMRTLFDLLFDDHNPVAADQPSL
jgi:hypothetical protein